MRGTLVMMLVLVSGCLSGPEASVTSADAPVRSDGNAPLSLGDRAEYTLGGGRLLIEVRGPVFVQNEFEETREAVAFRSTWMGKHAFTDTAYVDRATREIMHVALHCPRALEGDGVGPCVHHAMAFSLADSPAPLLLGAREAILEAPGALTIQARVGSVPRVVTYDVDAPDAKGCRSAKWRGGPPLIDPQGPSTLAPLVLATVCPHTPFPAAFVTGMGDLATIDHVVRGHGPVAFPAPALPTRDRILPALSPLEDGVPRGAAATSDPFPVGEAVQAAKTWEPSFAAYLRDHPDAVVCDSRTPGWGGVPTPQAGPAPSVMLEKEFHRDLELGIPGRSAEYSLSVVRMTIGEQGPTYRVPRASPTGSAWCAPGSPAAHLDAAESLARTFMEGDLWDLVITGGDVSDPFLPEIPSRYIFWFGDRDEGPQVRMVAIGSGDGRLQGIVGGPGILERFGVTP